MLNEVFDNTDLDDSFNQLVDSRYDWSTIRCFTLWVIDSLMMEMSEMMEQIGKTLE